MAYILYGMLTLFTIVFVGRTLYRNGRHFILKILMDESMTDQINHTLLTGFYLVNIGYVLLTLTRWSLIETAEEMVVVVAEKTGFILVVLGVLHFMNITGLYLLSQFWSPPKTGKH